MVQAIRHPWFNPPTMKRKLSIDDDGDNASSDMSSSTFPTSRRKRVKYNSLEHTLAHMTLGNALSTTFEDADMWPKPSLPRLGVQETILPSSIEEPGDMEVEPILVATDASTAMPSPHAVDDETGQLDIKEVQISSAVLECLQRQTKHPPSFVPLPCQDCQALVLYRAPRPPSPSSLEPNREGNASRTSILLVREDDVMEVE